MKIGVFDSGIGGLSVANAIQAAMSELEVVFRHDTPQHFPYATKTPDELYSFVVPVLDSLVAEGCQVIVVACNTVTTTLIGRLRTNYAVPLIGTEPMVRPAAKQTKSGTVIVCATPTTLASERYAELKTAYASDVTVIEPDCADWSALIERNAMTEGRIRDCIEPGIAAGADVIVLGCTHYHWIEDEIRELAGSAVTVLQPESAIIEQLKRVLERQL